jgi:hypothetical protein
VLIFQKICSKMEDNYKSDSDDEYDVHFISNAASRLQGKILQMI